MLLSHGLVTWSAGAIGRQVFLVLLDFDRVSPCGSALGLSISHNYIKEQPEATGVGFLGRL